MNTERKVVSDGFGALLTCLGSQSESDERRAFELVDEPSTSLSRERFADKSSPAVDLSSDGRESL